MNEAPTPQVGDLDPEAFRKAVLAAVSKLLNDKKFMVSYPSRAHALARMVTFNGLEIRKRTNLAFTSEDETQLESLALKMFLQMKGELAHATGMSSRSPDELEREISSMLQIIIGIELLRIIDEAVTPWE